MGMIGALLVLAAAAPAIAPPPPVAVRPPQPAVTAPAVPAAQVAPRFGFVTAAQLVERCNGQSSYALSYCYAYLAGVHDTLRAYEIWLARPEFCPPASATLEDTRRLLIAFLGTHPEYRDGQGASVSAVALKEGYPCPAIR